MEYLTVSQCSPARRRARERVQPSRLLVAANHVKGPPDRVPLGKGAQTPPRGLASKTRFHNVEDRMSLVLHKRHCALFVGSRDAYVGSVGSANFLLTGVPAEELAAVGIEHSGELD